jgi:hypothetical protein
VGTQGGDGIVRCDISDGWDTVYPDPAPLDRLEACDERFAYRGPAEPGPGPEPTVSPVTGSRGALRVRVSRKAAKRLGGRRRVRMTLHVAARSADGAVAARVLRVRLRR